MLQRLILLAAIIGAAYWYWTGPYQEKLHPSREAILQKNDENMARCMRGAAYKLGATGAGSDASLAKQQCADKYNLYQSDGHWLSYDSAPPK